MTTNTESVTTDGLEVVAYGLPSMVLFASAYEHEHGISPGCTVELVRKSDADTLLAASRAEVERLSVWRPMATAPRDQRILVSLNGEVRTARWGKTSHVPLYGFCLDDQGAEDFDICEPQGWLPMPAALSTNPTKA